MAKTMGMIGSWITGKPEPGSLHALEPGVDLASQGLGHPLRGTHKKMNERDEQELREFARLKHHSHGLKIQQFD
jgi:hypothetical protein